MFDQPHLGKALKKRRYELDIGLIHLAEASQVSVATICALENGTRKFARSDTLARLCDALGMDLQELAEAKSE